MFYTKTHIDILPKLYDSFKIRLTVQEMQVQSLGQEDPLEKEMATHSSILFFFSIYSIPVFLPGNPMERGGWQATVHGVYISWGCKRP